MRSLHGIFGRTLMRGAGERYPETSAFSPASAFAAGFFHMES